MHGCFSFIMTIFYSLSENDELGINLTVLQTAEQVTLCLQVCVHSGYLS